MRPTLAAFDWNGTLLADTAAAFDADNAVLEHFGGRRVDLNTYRNTINIPSVEFYCAHGCPRKVLEKRAGEWGEVFHGLYEERAAKVRLRRGARRLLEALPGMKVEAVILSNHTVWGIEAQLQRLGIAHCFAAVLANKDKTASNRRRSKLKRLAAYMKKRGIAARRVFIVGDSPEEAEIGGTLGATSIAITGGYYSKARLEAAHPDFMINNLDELLPIVRRLMKSCV